MTGAAEDFVIEGNDGYSIVAIWVGKRSSGALMVVRGHDPPGKFLKLKFSEMQSSAFWTLKFKQMPGFHIRHNMLKYVINKGVRC